jgi:hypothetical protein
MEMRGNVVHHRVKALLDPWEKKRYPATARAKQRRSGKPDIVATPPGRTSFDDPSGTR